MGDLYHGIRRHFDNPVVSHLRGVLVDIVSVFENLENHFVQRQEERLEVFKGEVMDGIGAVINAMETRMSELGDKLLAAVKDLSDTVNAADMAIQTAVADFKAAQGNGDPAAMQAAIEAISAASAKMKEDTSTLSALHAPAEPAPAAEPANPAPTAEPAAAAAEGTTTEGTTAAS